MGIDAHAICRDKKTEGKVASYPSTELPSSLLTLVVWSIRGLGRAAVGMRVWGFGEIARSEAVRVNAAARSTLASVTDSEPRLKGTEVKNDCTEPSEGEPAKRESNSSEDGRCTELTELGEYGAIGNELKDCIEEKEDEWLSSMLEQERPTLASLTLVLALVLILELEEEANFSPALTRQTSIGPELLRKNNS
jgi:hypothetical protein